MVEEKKSIGRRWGVMRQKKTMVILILILAVLAAIYGGLKAWGKKTAEKEAGAAAEKITVTDLKNLSSFSYSNGQETMCFIFMV